VALKVEKNAEQLVLIFGGKILKDSETLETHQIKDKMSVHLVIKQQRQESPPKAEETAPASSSQAGNGSSSTQPSGNTASASQQPNPFAAFGNMGGMGNMQQANQMLQNPEMMRQLMDSPVMQMMLDNPEMIQAAIRSNPQMRELMDNNPEIGHMINNPNLMRQALEMARNPSMMQEMMRNQDRALSNLEAIPGGFNALERLYRDVQEPMHEATARPNPFQNLANADNSSSTTSQAGQQNTEALPNPWGPPPAQTNTNQTNPQGTNSNTRANPFGAMGGLGSMNPEMINTAMDMMRQNPDLLRSVLNMSPAFAGRDTSGVAEQMIQRMQNPEVLQAMTNPAVIQAIQQIQEGTETLRREAPALFESMGLPNMPGAGPPSTGPNGAGQMGMMQQMLQQMSGITTGGARAAPVANPEERFASQLEQLASMGFTNRAACIEELQATAGNVEAAIDRLLSRPR